MRKVKVIAILLCMTFLLAGCGFDSTVTNDWGFFEVNKDEYRDIFNAVSSDYEIDEYVIDKLPFEVVLDKMEGDEASKPYYYVYPNYVGLTDDEYKMTDELMLEASLTHSEEAMTTRKLGFLYTTNIDKNASLSLYNFTWNKPNPNRIDIISCTIKEKAIDKEKGLVEDIIKSLTSAEYEYTDEIVKELYKAKDDKNDKGEGKLDIVYFKEGKYFIMDKLFTMEGETVYNFGVVFNKNYLAYFDTNF